MNNRVSTGMVMGRGGIVAAKKLVGNESAYNDLEQVFGEQWVQSIQGMKGSGALSDKEGERLGTTTGGLTKDEKFNTQDLEERIKAVNETITARQKKLGEARATMQRTRQAVGITDAPAGSPGGSVDFGSMPK